MKHTLKTAIALVAIALASCTKLNNTETPKPARVQTTPPADTTLYCKPCNDVGTVQ